MGQRDVSRRIFVAVAGAVTASQQALRSGTTLTARDAVQTIRDHLGGVWQDNTVDGFKAGNPDTPVTGIATTAMATVSVLKRALQFRTNLVITYEPTFFGRNDGPKAGFNGLAFDDPVYLAKKDFIEKNGLVVFRLHDHWQARNGNEMATGLAEALGWNRFRVKADDALYDIPLSTAEATVELIRKQLALRGGLRAVGDRRAPVRRVLLHPGVMSATTMWKRYGEADLVIAGEVREWENTFFAADLYSSGEKRGLVTIGRIASEDPGMQACATWLSSVVHGVPVRTIPTGDLYWRATG